MDVHIHEDHEAVSKAAATMIVQTAHNALERSGRFTIALAGGGTPKRTYELLACDPLWRSVPWDRTHVFFGDERMVPPDHEWSNYLTAEQALLSHVPLPRANIHRMRGELDPDSAADAYAAELRSLFGDGMPRFDLILLGLGPDGHTASIFPDSKTITETCTTAAVHTVPADPQVARVTLCLPVLNNAHRVVFLATGKDKKSVLDKMLNTKTAKHLFPGAMVNATETHLLTDQQVGRD
ncbi:6-phosphogluconolactonase [Salidesulfovibrio brasiliensis]|uniref:6-phosphogluconolactonase n=1 Tax=Salidesulfovibrio brasiliensis TaxID=221711 RepID=UPI0006CFCAC5|nr:6-phosphogluconolactonase [Salidesulfovibrio brasiliensis]